VQSVWLELVGERIAAVSHPDSERGGTIAIVCSDPVWAQELDLMQGELLDNLRKRLGDEAPQALRFEHR